MPLRSNSRNGEYARIEYAGLPVKYFVFACCTVSFDAQTFTRPLLGLSDNAQRWGRWRRLVGRYLWEASGSIFSW